MKQNYLKSVILLICMMMGAVASAQSWTASAPSAGTFYLYNVSAKKFMASGTSWGSRASIEPHGAMALTLAVSGSGYTISSNSIYTDRFLGDDGFLDNGTAAVWVFEAVSGQTNTYKLKNGSNYLYWDGTGTWSCSVGSDPGNDTGYWKLVTKANLSASLSNATLENPIDATYLIGNNWFAKGNGGTYGKDVVPTEWQGTTVTDYWGQDTWETFANYCVEQFHKTFDNYQSLTSVPNGTYTLSAQGFYRTGTDGKNGVPVLYANGNTQSLKLISEENSPVSTDHSLGKAADSFQQGYYQVSISTQVTDGTLRVGIKCSDSDVDWCAFDNFSLIYKGNVEPLSTAATEFPGNGTTLAANTWYYYVVPSNGEYKFTTSGSLSNFVYTTNGEQNVNGTVTASALEERLNLTSGRIYFKTSSSATLTINPPTPVSTAAIVLPNNDSFLAANQWYSYDAPVDGTYTLSGNYSNFVYTTDGTQNIYGETLNTTTPSASLDLTEGRVYFMTTMSSQTLKVTAPTSAYVEGVPVEAGDYYLYNLGAHRFMSKGLWWGTKATVDGRGEAFALAGSNNAFTIRFHSNANDKYLASDGYTDTGTSEDRYTTFTFEAVSNVPGYTNVYKLKANKTGNYYYWAGGSGYGGNSADVDGNHGNFPDVNSYWILIPKSTREDYSNATLSNPVDMTWKVANPDMEAGVGTVTVNGNNYEKPDSWVSDFFVQSNGSEGTTARFLEVWAGADFGSYNATDNRNYLYDAEVYQNLSALPAGHYRISINAKAVQQAEENLPVTGATFYAGTKSVALSGYNKYSLDFAASGGLTKVGVKVQGTNANWVYFDNVRLQYFGPIAIKLPNDNTTILEVDQWYYYDVTTMGPYTLEGPVANIVYTQNGDNLLDANAVVKNAQSNLILDSGRIYFKATTAGTTLKLTSVNEEGYNATFTAATLNVDGLPKQILFYDLNPDGPGSNGTKLISKYLKAKQYDLIAVQEDFEYNTELLSELSDYDSGAYRGSVGAGALVSPANTDGLNFLWNKTNGREANGESITRYNSTANTDGNQYIKKGFRYYEVTLADGLKIDVYITHMDAGDNSDAINSKNLQLTQLANAIVANSFTTRPKIIMGDTNCRYTRENIVTNFINPITATGNYTIHDVFVDQELGGIYPTVGASSLSNEVVDKIFYLNPTATGSAQLTPELYWRETDYTYGVANGTNDNTPLGDHAPVVTRFRIHKPATQFAEVKDRWAWTGETITYGSVSWYLYNVNFGRWDSGRNGFLSSEGTLVRDPNLSTVHKFAFYGDNSGASISNEYNKLRVWYGTADYKAGLISSNESGATTFKIFDTNDSESNPEYAEGVNLAYHFKGTGTSANNHFFGANSPTELDAHQGTSKLNAWALISSEQLAKYNEYCAAWDKANTYLTYLPLEDETKDALTELLQRTDVRWTDNTTEEIEALNTEIEAWFDDNLTSRIINPSFELDAQGNQLTTTGTTANHSVPGWVVPNDTEEGFVSHKNVSGTIPNSEETWSRNFNDVDGNYLFNTWGGTPANGYYVRQTISGLPEGFYKLKAVACTDEGNSITLEIGTSSHTTPFTVSRPLSQHLEVPLYYHSGESSLTIGASSNTWFEIDDFQLVRYDYYYDETISEVEFATTAIRYNTEIPAGVEVYYATRINPAYTEPVSQETRHTIHLEKYSGSEIAAGEGVILYKAGNNSSRQFRFYRTKEEVDAISGNALHGAVDRIEVADKQAGCEYYVLARKTITHDKTTTEVNEQTGEVTSSTVAVTEPVVGFYRLSANTAIPAHKAYIRVNANNELAAKQLYMFSFGDEGSNDDENTDIARMENETGVTVTGIYSLDGSQQMQLQRGVNIVRLSNGSVKKILVK